MMISQGRFRTAVHRSGRNPTPAPSESVQTDPGRIRKSRASALMFVLHKSPFSGHGGTEFHVRDLLEALRLERVVVAYPAGRELVAAEVFDGNVSAPVFYRFALRKSPDLVCIDDSEITGLVQHWTELFGISGCHIHHLSSWPISIGRVLAELKVPYLYTSHDFYAVCPNWHLFDYDLVRNCECSWKPGLDAGCLPAFTKAVGPVSSMELANLRYAHREAFREFVSHAAAILFPSEAARRRVLEAVPVDLRRTHVVEHGSDVHLRSQRAKPGTNLRIAAVGGVAGPRKGSQNYSELVLRTFDLPVEWHFFGAEELAGLKDKHLNSRRVQFHGRYRRDQIADLLAEQGVDLCVILPNVDETFSYVLSEAWTAGIPVLVNEKGSLPERVNKFGAGVVVNDLDQAVQWIQRFCNNRIDIQQLSERARAIRQPSNAEVAQIYRQLYRTLNVLRSEMKREPLKERFHQELVARRVAIDPGIAADDATPEYQLTNWYPKFLWIKPYIPFAVRQLGRKMLVIAERIRQNRRQTVINYQLRLENVQVLNRTSRTLELESTNAHPQVVFEVKPFRPASAQKIEFSLRHASNSHLVARLFWVHSFDENFREEKSVAIPLESDGKWHRYAVNVEGDLKAKWERGMEIVRLRFDPVNEPLRFELKHLSLGNFLLSF